MPSPTVALRAAPRLALALPARARRWIVFALIAAIALTVTYFAWFRDSSFVHVEKVTVTGLSGPEAPALRRKLEAAGRQQTTLNVKIDEIRAAVASAPEVRSVSVTPDFPHGLRIDVTENDPIAELVIPGRGRLPIAANGTLMPDAKGYKAVPELRIPAMPQTNRPAGQVRLDDPRTARLVAVVAAAPTPLLHKAASIGQRKGEGIVVQLREGPRIIFGDPSRLADKWAAAAAVLSSPGSSGTSYVDVRLPERPVAGGLKVQGEEAGAAPATPGAAPTTPQSTPGAAAQTPGAATTPSTPTPEIAPSTTTPAQPQQNTPPATAVPQQTAPSGPSTTGGATATNTQP